MRRARSIVPAFVVATVASVVAARDASAQVVPVFPPSAPGRVIAEYPPAVALDGFDSGARAPSELHAADAFERGTALAAANRHHEAALAFEESYAALPRPSTLYDIAQSYRAAGEPIRAIGAYRRYLALGSMSAARRAAVNATITAIGHRFATVTVRTAPPDAAVTIDGNAAASGVSIPLEPGSHVLALRAFDRVPITQVFRLQENENRDFVLALDHRPITQQAWFWTLVGAVVTSAALTTTAIVLAAHHDDPANCGTLNVCVSMQ